MNKNSIQIKSGGVWQERIINPGLPITLLEGSSDGTYFAFVMQSDRELPESEILQIWHAYSGELIHTLKEHTDTVTCLAFSPDTRLLASGSSDKTVRIWEVSTGNLLHTFLIDTADSSLNQCIMDVVFSPDGCFIASFSGVTEATVSVFNVLTGELVFSLAGEGELVNSVVFAPDSASLISWSWDKVALLWDIHTKRLTHTLTGHTDLIYSVALSPDGSYVATGSWDTTIRIWHIASIVPQSKNPLSTRLWHRKQIRLLHVLTGHTDQVKNVQFLPKADFLISSSTDETVCLWDVITGQRVRDFRLMGGDILPQHTRKTVEKITFCPHGLYMAISFSSQSVERLSGAGCRKKSMHTDKILNIWNIQTGELLHVLTGYTDPIFSPDGAHIALVSIEGVIYINDLYNLNIESILSL